MEETELTGLCFTVRIAYSKHIKQCPWCASSIKYRSKTVESFNIQKFWAKKVKTTCHFLKVPHEGSHHTNEFSKRAAVSGNYRQSTVYRPKKRSFPSHQRNSYWCSTDRFLSDPVPYCGSHLFYFCLQKLDETSSNSVSNDQFKQVGKDYPFSNYLTQLRIQCATDGGSEKNWAEYNKRFKINVFSLLYRIIFSHNPYFSAHYLSFTFYPLRVILIASPSKSKSIFFLYLKRCNHDRKNAYFLAKWLLRKVNLGFCDTVEQREISVALGNLMRGDLTAVRV